MTGAAMSAPTTSNTTLLGLTGGTALTLSTIYSGNAVASDTVLAITGGNSGYLTLAVSTAERVPTGSYKDYELQKSQATKGKDVVLATSTPIWLPN